MMSFSISFTLLAVVSGMLHYEITETGTEGNIAVITCPYGQGYESYTKYFCKGIYKVCETLIKTNGKDSWTYKDRISLTDDTEQKKLMVTISDLRMEDAGQYGCGIEITGRDGFTLVHLKVNKAPKPPKRTQSKPTQSSPPPATKHNESNAPNISTNNTGNFTSAVTNGTGRTEDGGNTTQPATHYPDSDPLLHVLGVFGGVLLALAIICGLFFVLKSSTGKETADTSQPKSEVNMEDARLYEEIQTTDAAQANGSVPTNQGTVPHSARDRCFDPHPACITIYSAITNQGLDSHSDDTCPAQHTHYAVTPIKGLHSETPQSSKEPNYCEVYFANDKTMDESPTYSLITAPKISTEGVSHYSAIQFPEALSPDHELQSMVSKQGIDHIYDNANIC
ncbi:hypothetical protein MHYP_G00103420 [Metynnis hypsauchen]